MTRLSALIAFLATLAGCAGSNYDIARRHDNLRDYTGADAGFVVASEGGERGRFDASGITFQRVGSEDLLSFYFAVRKMIGTPEHDFEAGSVIGKVNVVRLPPGDYEAVAVEGDQFMNNGTFRRRLAPGLRFTVKTGETVYLGRYVIAASGFNPDLSISDKQADDLALAKRRVPALPVDVVTSAVPPEGHRSY